METTLQDQMDILTQKSIQVKMPSTETENLKNNLFDPADGTGKLKLTWKKKQYTLQSGVVASDTVVTLVDGATPALDASLGNIFILTATGDRTIAVPSNPVTGQRIIIRHKASGAARTLALNTGAGGFRFGSTITALTQTVSGKTDYIGAIWNEVDSFWDVVAVDKGHG